MNSVIRATRRSLVVCSLLFTGTASASELPALPPIAQSDCFPIARGGISHDGRTLLTNDLCFGPEGGIEAFRGTLFQFDAEEAPPTAAPLGLGYFTDLSGDGRSVLGNATELDPFGNERSRAFILRDLQETIDLGFLASDNPFFVPSTFARAISADGSTVVGTAADPSCRSSIPAIWTESSGLQPLPGLPANPPIPDAEEEGPDCPGGQSWGVSSDGSIVVGRYLGEAFRWDARRGARPVAIDDPRGGVALYPETLSSSGRFVVGLGIIGGSPSTGGGELQPALWSHLGGLVDLRDPFSGASRETRALDVAGDGEVVVGGELQSDFSPMPTFEDRAFVWTPERGARDLREVLEEIGVETSGWASLVSAWRVSDDGSTVVGSGVRWNRDRAETFRSRLTPPAPAGVGGCVVGQDGCFAVEVIARSGQAIRRSDDRQSSSLEVLAFFDWVSVNPRGDVAYSGSVLPAFTLPDEPLPNPTPVVFGPDGRGAVRACPWRPLAVAEPGVDERWSFAPGPNGTRDFALLADGSVVLSGQILNLSEWPGVPERQGIWRCRGRAGELSSAFRLIAGQPDESGELIDSILRRFQVDGLGRVSLVALSKPADQPEAIPSYAHLITGPSGAREPIFRAGELPPGIPDLPFLGSTAFNMSASGKFVLAGALDGPPLPNIGLPGALWASNASGGIEVVYRSGEAAPGDASGRIFGSAADPFQIPAINDRGEIAFGAALLGGPRLDSSIWKRSPDGGLAKIVEEQTTLPGLPPERTLEGVRDPLIDAEGNVLFMGMLDFGPVGSNDAYWLRTNEGTFVPLLRTGQQAPGLPEGVLLGASSFEEVPADPELAYMAMSAGGLALLEFALTGPGIDATNDRALYVVNRAGQATLVVRRGDTIRTASDEMRTIDSFRVWYGYRGETARRPINDRGDVVAILDFSDETSAVVRFATPEPEGATTIAAALIALAFAHRSRMRGAGGPPSTSRRVR